MDVERLRDLLSRSTPGPWRWVINLCGNHVGIESSRWMVVDFVRWGMSKAAPAFFHPDTGYQKLMDVAEVEPGREHHASWHRVLKHPNAELLMEAVNALPELLDERDALLSKLDTLERENQRLQKVAEQATSDFSQYKGRWVTPGNQFLSHRENPELAAYLAERAGTAVKTEVTGVAEND